MASFPKGAYRSLKVSYKLPICWKFFVLFEGAFKLPTLPFTTPWKGWSVVLFMRKAHPSDFSLTAHCLVKPMMLLALLFRCCCCFRSLLTLQLCQHQEPS